MPLPLRHSRVAPPPPGCALGECLALLRGAWAPNVIWYLGAGPRRFGELRQDLPGVSAKVLATRLRELEARGVVSRQPRPTSPPSVEYALTALGSDLLPGLRALVAVGERLKRRR